MPCAMLNRNRENGHLCLVSDLRRKVFSLRSFSMMLGIDLSHSFSHVEQSPFYDYFIDVFNQERGWILLSTFSLSTEMIMLFS